MKYMKSGEEEMDLGEEFNVGLDEGSVVLEIFGGSTEGEFYTLSLDEAERLLRRLFDAVVMNKSPI